MVNINTRRNTYNWDLIDSWKYGESLSYNSIRLKHLELFGFAPSKGTLSNRYGKGVAEKARVRRLKISDTLPFRLSRKLDNFKHKIKRHFSEKKEYVTSDWDRFRDTLKKFRNKRIGNMQTWTTRDCMEKFWPNGVSKCGHKFPFIECYLTGDVINVTDTTTHCDHIDPNGGNSLENLGFTTKYANVMKSDQNLDELYDMCEKLLKHRGEVLR